MNKHQRDNIRMSIIDDTLSATDLACGLAEGRIGSRDLLEHYLARIERHNAPVNAVIALDTERARRRADEADAATRRGERWGPLHGLPMTLKDTWEVPGLPCTAGAPQFRDHHPQRPAAVVQRLQQGQRVAYVSDAGTPGVSDPGARLVAAVHAAGLRALPLPGASSISRATSATRSCWRWVRVLASSALICVRTVEMREPRASAKSCGVWPRISVSSPPAVLWVMLTS